MSESKTPRTDAVWEKLKYEIADDMSVTKAVNAILHTLRKHGDDLETELAAALQRAEKAETENISLRKDKESLREALINESKFRQETERQRSQLESVIDRYREAEKALPVEPPRWEDRTDKRWPVTVVPKWAYDALRAHAAALQAEREALKYDIDRLIDANVEILKENDSMHEDTERWKLIESLWLCGETILGFDENCHPTLFCEHAEAENISVRGHSPEQLIDTLIKDQKDAVAAVDAERGKK